MFRNIITKQIKNPGSFGFFNVDRCKALVDGVFAIVVTLLVLGINVPTDHNFSEQGLISFLWRIGFELIIYAISFWLAATYWLQHAAIMHFFHNGSRNLVWLNLLFLFPVTLLPFITELKGTYRHEVSVTLMFAAVQILIGFALLAIWQYASVNPQLLKRKIDRALKHRVTLRMLISPIIVSVLAVPISLLNVHLGSLMFISIPLYYLSHMEIDQYWCSSNDEEK